MTDLERLSDLERKNDLVIKNAHIFKKHFRNIGEMAYNYGIKTGEARLHITGVTFEEDEN